MSLRRKPGLQDLGDPNDEIGRTLMPRWLALAVRTGPALQAR